VSTRAQWYPSEVEKYSHALRRLSEGATRGEIAGELGVHRNTVRAVIKRAEAWSQSRERLEVTQTPLGKEVTSTGRIRTLADLMLACGIDRRAWRCRSYSCNKWDAMTAAVDGAGNELRELYQVKAQFERVEPWQNKTIDVINPIKPEPVQPIERSIRRALIIPDSQNGLIRHKNRFEPTHDRRAWDLCVQVCQQMQPDAVVMLGDMLDFPTLSRFSTTPAQSDLIQPTLAELYWWISQLRLVTDAPIIYIAGNHEARLERALLDSTARDVALVHPVDSTDTRPLLSVPRLMALDSLSVQYVAPYGSEFWLWDKIRIHHGNIARTGGGATVASALKSATTDEIFGHVHRLAMAGKRITDSQGARNVWVMTPGCICRVDAPVVPGTKPRTDWQQGIGVVTMTPPHAAGPALVSMEAIPIQNARMVYGGALLHGRDRTDEIRTATGWSWF